MPKVPYVAYLRIPRLTKEGFDKCLSALYGLFPDIQLSHKGYDEWYEKLISFPDDVVFKAFIHVLGRIRHFPDVSDIVPIAFDFFPQRDSEIDTAKTLSERERRTKLLHEVAERIGEDLTTWPILIQDGDDR